MPAGLNRLRAISIGIAAAAVAAVAAVWVAFGGVDDAFPPPVPLSVESLAMRAWLILAACSASLSNCCARVNIA